MASSSAGGLVVVVDAFTAVVVTTHRHQQHLSWGCAMPHQPEAKSSCIAQTCLLSSFSSSLSSSSRSDDDYEDTNNADDDYTDDDDDDEEATSSSSSLSAETASNVLGTLLCSCCENVRDTGIGTGFYRNGYCSTGEQDLGRHTLCVQVTDEFLEFSASVGNDLSTPFPEYMFPGLKNGDLWCLCAQRWVQAYQAGKAPKLYLKATHEKTLTYAPYDILRQFAIDGDETDKDLDDLNKQRERLGKLL